MKASETKFLSFLKGPKQFIIPIYQRTYSWTLRQCEQLWNDIHRVSDDSVPAHFVGSIVYVERGLYQVSSIPQLLVIDGQQRLTTLSLLLSALARSLDACKVEGDLTGRKVRNYFLLNSEENGELRFKLVLTQGDKPTLIRLVEEKDPLAGASRRVLENYAYFADKIAKLGQDDLLRLYRGLDKLTIVDIALDRERDNPQLIFESLNSTGLELSQADLIRNFVLMGLEPKEQENLYTMYWHPMEESFGSADDIKLFDRFMRDFLTVKTGSIPNISEVYAAFKIYSRSQSAVSIRELVAEIYESSKCFVRMTLAKEEDQDLRDAFADLNTLKVDVAYPLLLELYRDYAEGVLTREAFVTIVRLVESYVFRRAICGIPTNSLNKTFATLAREIKKDKYVESFSAAMALKDSYRRFPMTKEFEQELTVKDVYNFRNRNYLLRKLENYDRKERVVVDEYTIEHIMPQNENLSKEWQDELGPNWKDVRMRYLHTLGNLTLTGYNAELSDRSFREKRSMKGGFADSPIRLNQGLGALQHWNEEMILQRAQNLAKLAAQVWPYLPIDGDTLIAYAEAAIRPVGEKTYTLEDHTPLSGAMRDLFEHLRKRILNLDASVHERIRKNYIAYKASTNFVDVRVQRKRLLLSLNIPMSSIRDPKRLCKNVDGIGHWGNGDIVAALSSPEQLDDVMELIRQAFEEQTEDTE